jgi:MYXO-CTERM domain-containing protein
VASAVERFIRWFQLHLPFGINEWPTWSNEAIGGVAFMLLLLLPALRRRRFASWAFPIFLVLSTAYEVWLDPWGWSGEDVAWRMHGAIAVEIVRRLVYVARVWIV